jgi:hypothetical protein
VDYRIGADYGLSEAGRTAHIAADYLHRGLVREM